MAKQARKRKKRSAGNKIGLFLLLLLAAAFLVGFFLCRTEELHVEGNTILSEEELKGLLLAPEHTDNSLYFWYYYTHRYHKEIPFADSVEVKFHSLTEVTAVIREEESIGYMRYADSRAYFDRSGTVNEISSLEVPGVPRVEGVDLQVIEKDEPLPIEDLNLLKSLLTACKEICRLNMEIDHLEIDQKGMMTIRTETIEVSLGQGQHLEDKIPLAYVLLEKLQGKTGVLHLEDYDGTNGTRSFRETVPKAEDTENSDENESPDPEENPESAEDENSYADYEENAEESSEN